ncbi:MAG: two-component SAPR family response regulator, partial [Kiritimatiellia bacterium]
VEDGPPVHLYPDWSAVCGGLHVKAIELPLSSSSSGRTRVELSVQHNLRIVGRFDHVHIHRDDQSVVRITGKQARLFNAVAEVGAPVHWSAIAEQIWPEVQHTHVQRRRWDTTMLRLRRHLQACGLRPDLLRNDGRGHFELGLEDGDIWEDQG